MRLTQLILLMLLTLGGCAGMNAGRNAGAAKSPKVYGEPSSKTNVPQVPIQMLLANPADYDGKYLRIMGTVSQVCTKKGCWLAMGDPEADGLFVKFTCPIEGRLIPLEAVGESAIVEGTVTVTSMSEDQARHYKQDAGGTPEEIAQIVGPQKRITVESPSATISIAE